MLLSLPHSLGAIRTSVDHGTGFDIAGQGIADVYLLSLPIGDCCVTLICVIQISVCNGENIWRIPLSMANQ
ncbi:4-hydroxythreonine-4-phosphate dehydrogenase PdxA [Candidatus Saganbacteria bacterium]|nr:4-hydroxythreonine-4-phosphate dehydrogenase PdxA [Candidatus Saganbacteria bacterium]